MSELLVADDIASPLCKVLRAALAERSEPWSRNVAVMAFDDGTTSGRRVLVRDDGGSRVDFVRDLADVTVNVWAQSFGEAKLLAAFVRGVLARAPDSIDSLASVASLSRPSEIPGHQEQRYIAATYIHTTAAIEPSF